MNWETMTPGYIKVMIDFVIWIDASFVFVCRLLFRFNQTKTSWNLGWDLDNQKPKHLQGGPRA